MWALLENSEPNILTMAWVFSAIVMLLACLVTIMMVIQRFFANGKNRRSRHQEEQIRNLLDEVIGAGSSKVVILPETKFKSGALSKTLLQYFRTYKGERLSALRHFVEVSGVEGQLCKATHKGVPGERVRAVQVLSYLDTEGSLSTIVKNLSSRRPYKRIVAARALARRGALQYCEDVAFKLAEVFPQNTKLIAELLGQFGADIVPALEKIVGSTPNETVIIACLETLAEHLKSPTIVDLPHFARHENENIRAAALSVAAVSGGLESEDLARALRDTTTTVKITSAKLACTLKDSSVSLELCDLANDDHFWVRYWSVRALLALGDSGSDIVAAIKSGGGLASEMAQQVCAEVEAHV